MKSKKQIALLLVLVLSIMLVGCNSTPVETTAPNPQTTSGSEATSESKPSIDFPTKAITWVVPYAAGGSSDMSARPLADKLQELMGKSVVVKNTAGAGGTIGASEVVRSKADGYTVLNASIGPLTIGPYTSDVGYDYTAFAPVSQLTDIPLALAVHKNSPFQTLEDFIAYAKANPGSLRIGNPGAGNVQHVAMSYFESVADISITHVPYEGANPAVAALLGEHIDGIMTSTTELTPHYNDGTFRLLAMTGEERLDLLPEVKTFGEEGYPDVVFGVWYGAVVPKDTPIEVIEILDQNIKLALESDSVIDAMDKLNLIIAYKNHTEFGARIAKDAETNQAILKSLGLAVN